LLQDSHLGLRKHPLIGPQDVIGGAWGGLDDLPEEALHDQETTFEEAREWLSIVARFAAPDLATPTSSSVDVRDVAPEDPGE
jgi:hypothetical protein